MISAHLLKIRCVFDSQEVVNRHHCQQSTHRIRSRTSFSHCYLSSLCRSLSAEKSLSSSTTMSSSTSYYNGCKNSDDDEFDRDFAEIVVVRHGETSWNAQRIVQGHLDAELNDAGRQQATAVARRLSKEYKFAAAYSSDLKRAAETAKIICAACNLNEVVQDPTLRERNLGDMQGMTLQEAAKLKPKAYKDFLSPNVDQEIHGGGESVDQLFQRCTLSVEKIAKKHTGEKVLVVTHGGVIRELYKRAHPRKAPGRKIPNTSVNVIHISNDGTVWKIKTWGDISHLRGAGFLKDSFGGDKTSG